MFVPGPITIKYPHPWLALKRTRCLTLTLGRSFDGLSNVISRAKVGCLEAHFGVGSVRDVITTLVRNDTTAAAEVVEEATTTFILGVVFGACNVDFPRDPRRNAYSIGSSNLHTKFTAARIVHAGMKDAGVVGSCRRRSYQSGGRGEESNAEQLHFGNERSKEDVISIVCVVEWFGC